MPQARGGRGLIQRLAISLCADCGIGLGKDIIIQPGAIKHGQWVNAQFEQQAAEPLHAACADNTAACARIILIGRR